MKTKQLKFCTFVQRRLKMKHLLVVLMALMFVSCYEDCQECTETALVKIEAGGVVRDTVSSVDLGEHCDEELDNIKERDGNVDVQGNEHYKITTVTKIECK